LRRSSFRTDARLPRRNNKIIDNDNGLRIKTYDNQAGASVSNVRYTGNVVRRRPSFPLALPRSLAPLPPSCDSD